MKAKYRYLQKHFISNKLTIVGIIIIGVSIFFLTTHNFLTVQKNDSLVPFQNTQSPSSDEQFGDLVHIEDMAGNPTLSSLPAKQVSEERKDQFRQIVKSHFNEIPVEKLADAYNEIGFQNIINILQEEDRFCHTKAHNVGKVVYDNLQDLGKSISQCSSNCAGGCFHGVLMRAFQSLNQQSTHVTSNDLKQKAEVVCEVSAKNGYSQGPCIHGIGHAFLYLQNGNINRAIADCYALEQKGLIYYCATGVYMEVFQNPKTKYPDNGTPCDKAEFPAACYRYQIAGQLKQRSWEHVKDFCLSRPTKKEQRGCMHGLGFNLYQSLIENPEKLIGYCQSEDPLNERLCIEGAIGVLSVFDKATSEKVCATFSGDNELKLSTNEPELSTKKQICEKAIEVSNFGMNREFNYYVN